MKKALILILVFALSLSVSACASPASIPNAPDNQIQPQQTPVPSVNVSDNRLPTPAIPVDEVPLETLMADFATKIQAGSAGSSLKAVGQAVRFMDWAVDTYMSEEEIFAAVDFYLSGLDDATLAEYMMQLELLDYTYQLLLTPGQEELLATAGCSESNYPWSDKPLRAAESFMNAAGLRDTYQLPMEYVETADVYAELLRNYYLAFNEGWDEQFCSEKGLNYMFIMEFSPYEPLNNLGYAKHDINADGLEELIIADMNTPTTVYQIYSQQGGQPFNVFEGWARNVAYICSDGSIVVRGSGGAAVTYYTYYKLDGTTLNVFGSVIHDGNTSPNAPWFVSQDGDMDITNDLPASQEQAQSIISQYEAMYIPFSLTPLSALA